MNNKNELFNNTNDDKDIAEERLINNENNTNYKNNINYDKKLNNEHFDKKNENKYNYLEDHENRKKNIETVKKEFNSLADLLTVKSTNEKQIFKIDLFKNDKSNSNNKDDEIIEIERESYDLKKAKGMFDDFDIKNTNEYDDDLLDLMDKVTSK